MKLTTESWILDKRSKMVMEVAQMRMLKWICRVVWLIDLETSIYFRRYYINGMENKK